MQSILVTKWFGRSQTTTAEAMLTRSGFGNPKPLRRQYKYLAAGTPKGIAVMIVTLIINTYIFEVTTNFTLI